MISRVKREILHHIFWYQQKKHHKYSFIHINKCGGTSIEAALALPKTHDTAYFRREKLGNETWSKLITFAVVRHPYSRILSDYNFRVKTNQNNLQTKKVTFDEWIKKTIIDRDHFYYDKPKHFSSCWQWVTDLDRKSVIVDHIYKLEEIDDHWHDLCFRIGLSHVGLLPHENKTEESKIEDAITFMSEESRYAIRTHFCEDFDNFNYEG